MPRRGRKPRVRRLKKSRKLYQSDARYIRAFYQQNKAYIDSHIDPDLVSEHESPYQAFKLIVQDQQTYTNPKTGNKYTVQEAIRRELRSKEMNKDWTTADVYANNFLNLIKNTTDLRKSITELSNEEKITYERTLKSGKKITVTRLKEGFKKEKINFEGYFSVMGTSAIVYSYDDVYIIEYISPKAGSGATFDVVPKEEFERKLGKEIVFVVRRKRG